VSESTPEATPYDAPQVERSGDRNLTRESRPVREAATIDLTACRSCHGSGICRSCHGSGMDWGCDPYSSKWRDCSTCWGTGEDYSISEDGDR
jgi:hypothetical protein